MEYEIIRSKRKTLSMSVDRDGKLIIRAPFYTKQEQILSFIHKNESWILRQVEVKRNLPKFEKGERVEILGTIREIKDSENPVAYFEDKYLFLPHEDRLAALEKLLRTLTRERMELLVQQQCSQYGFYVAAITVTSAKKRWASCSSKNRLSFSFHTAFLPDDLAEYIVLHELCHTIEMNHSKRFWNEVQMRMPDYKKRRAQLKKYRWAMLCIP